jgi:hypothetical protein
LKVKEVQTTFPSNFRLALTLVIVLMVISSPVVMLVNPAQVPAYSRVIENSKGYSNNSSSVPM